MFKFEVGYHIVSGYCVTVADREFALKEYGGNMELVEKTMELLKNSGGAICMRTVVPEENIEELKALVESKVGHLGELKDHFTGVTIDYDYFKQFPEEVALAVIYHELGHAEDDEFNTKGMKATGGKIETINRLDLEITADNNAVRHGYGKPMMKYLFAAAYSDLVLLGFEVESKEDVIRLLSESKHEKHAIIKARIENIKAQL